VPVAVYAVLVDRFSSARDDHTTQTLDGFLRRSALVPFTMSGEPIQVDHHEISGLRWHKRAPADRRGDYRITTYLRWFFLGLDHAVTVKLRWIDLMRCLYERDAESRNDCVLRGRSL
jgi:hypothetical protein